MLSPSSQANGIEPRLAAWLHVCEVLHAEGFHTTTALRVLFPNLATETVNDMRLRRSKRGPRLATIHQMLQNELPAPIERAIEAYALWIPTGLTRRSDGCPCRVPCVELSEVVDSRVRNNGIVRRRRRCRKCKYRWTTIEIPGVPQRAKAIEVEAYGRTRQI